jgi:hypothetical protein
VCLRVAQQRRSHDLFDGRAVAIVHTAILPEL